MNSLLAPIKFKRTRQIQATKGVEAYWKIIVRKRTVASVFPGIGKNIALSKLRAAVLVAE